MSCDAKSKSTPKGRKSVQILQVSLYHIAHCLVEYIVCIRYQACEWRRNTPAMDRIDR